MATATAETSRSAAKPATGPHGAEELPSVVVTSYNLEVRDEDGFVGDKASRSAFVEHLDALRAHLKRNGDDPLDGETARISKKELDALLKDGDAAEAALVLSAVEGFAQSLAFVIRRFARLKSWAEIERIVIGGGFRESRIGELAIARAAIILRTDGRDIDIDALFVGPRTQMASPLAEQLGCEFDEGPLGPVIRVDDWKQTTVSGVFAANAIRKRRCNRM